MDLKDIKRVEDLTIMSDINRRLEEGWILIGTYNNNYNPHVYPGETTFHYVVGLPEGVQFTDIPQDTYYNPIDELENLEDIEEYK